VPVGAGLALTPATLQVAPGEARTITASGGSGAGLTWTLTSNASGGSVVPGAGGTSALYTAGHAGGVTDTLQVADSLGNVAGASITVTAGLRIAPASAKPPPRGAIQFTASGGGPGSTQVWSLLVHPSGGSISSATGAYTAGPVGGVTDVVGVSDALGNSATSTIAVGPGVSVAASATSAPAGGAVEFTATGGSGQDFTWAITANSSGGTIDAATGAYRAGATSGGTDTIQAEDSLGNTGTASVAVVARPAGGCGSTGGATGSWVLALVLAALQRRRR
jgi:uncharacterized protein (TIGR03382 family)